MAARTKAKVKTSARKKKVSKGHSVQKARKKSLEEEEQRMDVLEFIQAVDRYKRRTQKAFPPWSDILKILKSLGYRKIVKS